MVLIPSLMLAIAAWASVPARHCERWLSAEESVAEAVELTAGAMALRGLPLEETMTYPTPEIVAAVRARGLDLPHAEKWTVRGVPAEARLVTAPENMVFRHFAPLDVIERIRGESLLKTGYVSYVQFSPGLFKRTYVDLNGLFLALPRSNRHSVGVSGHGIRYGYVDVKLPAGVPVIRLEQDIYLVALRPRTQDWIANMYWARQAGDLDERSESYYGRDLDELAARGGPNTNPAAIPVTIVGYGTD